MNKLIIICSINSISLTIKNIIYDVRYFNLHYFNLLTKKYTTQQQSTKLKLFFSEELQSRLTIYSTQFICRNNILLIFNILNYVSSFNVFTKQPIILFHKEISKTYYITPKCNDIRR